MPPLGSNPSHEKQHDEDDRDRAERADIGSAHDGEPAVDHLVVSLHRVPPKDDVAENRMPSATLLASAGAVALTWLRWFAPTRDT